jgi:hypothetical protein
MGRKHSRKRQHVLLCIACWLSLSLVGAGCALLHKPGQEEKFLLRAESSSDTSDFKKLVAYWRELYELFPETRGDQALYIMGMAYAFPKNPDANYETSMNLFKTLIREYPESAFRNQAKIWTHILDNSIKMEKEINKKNKEINLLKNKLKAEDKKNRDLTHQIKRLKEIDLGIEEKKRKILPENGQ